MEAWRHLSVPAWTIDLELRAAGNSAGSLTPPSCTPQNHSVPLITRCLNPPHVTSQCNVARDWVRYAPFCFCCASRGRKWGPQHHRFITGPPTPPTKRQNGKPLSYIAPWYIYKLWYYVEESQRFWDLRKYERVNHSYLDAGLHADYSQGWSRTQLIEWSVQMTLLQHVNHGNVAIIIFWKFQIIFRIMSDTYSF